MNDVTHDASAGATASPDPTEESRGHRRPFAAGKLLAGVTLGCAATLLAWGAYSVVAHRDPLPELTTGDLDAALDRWEASLSTDYDLELVLSGDQSGVVRIEVRDDQVIAMTRDGRVPRDQRTWDAWTIPSLLDVMRQDLEHCRSPAGELELVLRAEFDQQTGIPLAYRRIGLGTQREVSWRITRFSAH